MKYTLMLLVCYFKTTKQDVVVQYCSQRANYPFKIASYMLSTIMPLSLVGVSTVGGAIHSISTKFHIPLFFGYLPYKNRCILLVEHNHARKGGGVYFERSSKLYVSKDNVILIDFNVHKFINDSAHYGGALFVADDTNSGTCLSTSSTSVLSAQIECTLQIIVLYEFYKPQIHYKFPKGFLFSGNSATIAGQDLYGGLLDRCIASPYAEARQMYVDLDSELTGLPYLKAINNISENTITSDPVQICFCVNDTQNCSYEHPTVYAK